MESMCDALSSKVEHTQWSSSLYILPSSWCTCSPSCYLTWKKNTQRKKSSLCGSRLSFIQQLSQQRGGRKKEPTLNIYPFFKAANLRIKRCNKGFKIRKEKCAVCTEPLEISWSAQSSSEWTPARRRRRRCCNFLPRSGGMLGFWRIVSRDKVEREQKSSRSSVW